MHILVIGGSGMIGPGVVRAARARGYAVTVVHRGRTPFVWDEEISIVNLDRRSTEFQVFLAAHRFDTIVDLAAYTAADIDRLAVSVPIGQHVVMTSSILVHGGDIARPISESSPIALISTYARRKYGMERAAMRHATGGRIVPIIVRLGACFREGCYLDGQLFEDTYWLGPLRRGSPSLLADQGNALWSVLHADDVGVALIALAACSRAAGETVIVANHEALSWNDYYALAARSIGGQFHPYYLPSEALVAMLGEDSEFLREMSLYDQIYELSKLDRLIGPFEPSRDLRSSLADAIRDVSTRTRPINRLSRRLDSILVANGIQIC